MVIKVYISGISGNKEVKKRQQRVLMILDSKNIKYEVVDIAEPGNEVAKEFMQNNAKSMGATVGDANPRSPLPPQIFNDEEYCGDYDQFDLSNEIDEIEKYLKLPIPESDSVVTSSAELKLGNGEINSTETVQEKQETNEAEAKKDNTEEPEPSENVPSESKEKEVTNEEEIVTSESKIENETEDNKLENGNTEAETVTTEEADVAA